MSIETGTCTECGHRAATLPICKACQVAARAAGHIADQERQRAEQAMSAPLTDETLDFLRKEYEPLAAKGHVVGRLVIEIDRLRARDARLEAKLTTAGEDFAIVESDRDDQTAKVMALRKALDCSEDESELDAVARLKAQLTASDAGAAQDDAQYQQGLSMAFGHGPWAALDGKSHTHALCEAGAASLRVALRELLLIRSTDTSVRLRLAVEKAQQALLTDAGRAFADRHERMRGALKALYESWIAWMSNDLSGDEEKILANADVEMRELAMRVKAALSDGDAVAPVTLTDASQAVTFERVAEWRLPIEPRGTCRIVGIDRTGGVLTAADGDAGKAQVNADGQTPADVAAERESFANIVGGVQRALGRFFIPGECIADSVMLLVHRWERARDTIGAKDDESVLEALGRVYSERDTLAAQLAEARSAYAAEQQVHRAFKTYADELIDKLRAADSALAERTRELEEARKALNHDPMSCALDSMMCAKCRMPFLEGTIQRTREELGLESGRDIVFGARALRAALDAERAKVEEARAIARETIARTKDVDDAAARVVDENIDLRAKLATAERQRSVAEELLGLANRAIAQLRAPSTRAPEDTQPETPESKGRGE